MYEQFQLDCIPLPPPSLSSTITHSPNSYLLTKRSSHVHPSTSRSSHTTGCVSSTFSHFLFTPLLLPWDAVPSAPPAPPAHLGVISSRPVRWCEISPATTRFRGNPSSLVCTSSFLFIPQGTRKISLTRETETRSWFL